MNLKGSSHGTVPASVWSGEENCGNPQSGWSVTQQRHELGISQLKVYSVTISEQLGTCSLL
jgi:hypothetical protein